MMKKLRWILLTGLCVSLFSLAACAADTQYRTEYETETGGTPAHTSEAFSPDGVLNEELYSSVRWMNTYALDRAEGERDLDRVKTLAASAAQLNMTVFFRDSGMYAAIDVTNEAGKAAYVGKDRDESLNSGVELLIKNDRIKLSPAGTYTWERQTDGVWQAYPEAEPCVLGARAKTAPLNEEGNTGYSLEFFLPAADLNAMGLDAAALARGEETLALDAVLVSSYGADETAAARWELSALLSWDDLYEFGADGAQVCDITVELAGETGGSAVAEASLRDYTMMYDDTTFLVKAAEGYRLRSFTVGGVEYDVTYLHGGFETGYVTLLTDEVTGDLAVRAEFEKNIPVSFETTVETVRFGTQVPLDGVTVTFEENGRRYSFEAAEGRLSGMLPCGVYRASVSGGLYDPQTVSFDGERLAPLRFTYRAFASDKFGDAYGGYLDLSRVNRENGVIGNIDGNSFFPVTNEAFGDSVFTATFRASQMTKESRLGIRYLWDEKTNEKQMRNAVIAEMQMQGGVLYAGWADYSDNWNNYNVSAAAAAKTALPASFARAFTGSGVSLTLVRTGDTFRLYASVAGDDASRVYVTQFTLDNAVLEGMDGHWAVYIWDSANAIDVPFSLGEDVSSWQDGSYTVTDLTGEGAHGSVSYESVPVGAPVTFTFAPEEGCTLLSFTINGEEYISKVQDNALTLYENVPLSMTVKAVFGVENHTAEIDLSGAEGRLEQGDLTLVYTSASGDVYARYDGGNAWKASLAAGTYSYRVTAFGGCVIESGTVEVTDGGRQEIAIAASDLDLAIPDQRVNGSAEMLGALGTPVSFVYSGFMGLEGASIEDVTRFAAETRFVFENGSTMELQLVRWDNTYEIKFMINDQNNGVSYMVTSERAPDVFERLLEDNGVWFTVAVQNGAASVWAKNTDDEWEQVKTWEGDTVWEGVPGNSPVVKVEFRKRYDGSSQNYAVLKDAVFQLGTSTPELG